MNNFESIEYLLEYINVRGDKMAYPTDLKAGIIGIVERYTDPPMLLLDKEKCIDILIERDKMTYEEASEYFDYNVLGTWAGDATPCFATLIKPRKRNKNV